MKSFKLIFIPIFIFPILIACSKDSDNNFNPVEELNPDTIAFEHSMKGYELYSWPNGNDWNYSILPGTNRIKSLEEVIDNRIVVYGKDSLKQLLDKMPVNECIYWEGENWLDRIWDGNYGTLCLPGSDLVNEIIRYGEERQLIINVLN